MVVNHIEICFIKNTFKLNETIKLLFKYDKLFIY